jgi:hypothetical protein
LYTIQDFVSFFRNLLLVPFLGGEAYKKKDRTR